MSIGSIDVVTLAPRTLGAAETQGKEMNQNQNISDQNAVQFQQNTEHEARKTVETQESDTKDYDREGSNGGARKRDSSRKKKKEVSKEQKAAPRSASSFDIMI